MLNKKLLIKVQNLNNSITGILKNMQVVRNYLVSGIKKLECRGDSKEELENELTGSLYMG